MDVAQNCGDHACEVSPRQKASSVSRPTMDVAIARPTMDVAIGGPTMDVAGKDC